MLLSTQTDIVFQVLGEKEGLSVFADAGYDALDYSMFFLSNDNHPLCSGDVVAHAKALRSDAEALGLKFNQAHAPFPTYLMNNETYNATIRDRIERSIRIAGVLGAKTIVVHPFHYAEKTPDTKAEAEEAEKLQMEKNLEYYRSLAPIAREYGIKICLENMWGYDSKRGCITPIVCSTGEDLARYYDTLNDSEAFTVCLDLGHCGLVGEDADHAIRMLGGARLGALHVHDNNHRSDSHVMPFEHGYQMDWDAIFRALGEIGYKGDFTYEADNFLKRFPKEVLPHAVKFMASAGREFIKMIDGYRK